MRGEGHPAAGRVQLLGDRCLELGQRVVACIERDAYLRRRAIAPLEDLQLQVRVVVQGFVDVGEGIRKAKVLFSFLQLAW